MTDLHRLQKVWDGLATHDPMGAILADPTRKGNKWDSGEFFETGRREINTVLDHVRSQGLTPDFGGNTLDFGCGVGRLTQALASRFARVFGVDISETMVERAQRHNGFPDSCKYICSTSNTLPFGDEEFSFIYSSIALQHIEPRYIEKYIAEFLRVLCPGGILVFQLADQRKGESFRRLAGRIRRQARRPLEVAGLVAGLMEVHCLTEARVRAILASESCRIVDVRITNSLALDFNGDLQYLAVESRKGYVSKQYCVVKAQVRPGGPLESIDRK
jgi:SAM-dependent methyltransferase